MAIYRPPKPRWPLALAAAVVGLVVGSLVGLMAGRTEPDPAASVGGIRSALLSAAGSLEVAAVEYRESVEHGEVVEEAEYQGSLSALQSSRAKFDRVRSGLVSLFPAEAASMDELYARAQDLMESKAAADDVDTVLEELQARLKGDAPG